MEDIKTIISTAIYEARPKYLEYFIVSKVLNYLNRDHSLIRKDLHDETRRYTNMELPRPRD